MEVYFDPDVLKQVAPEFQQDLLEGLTECRYSQVSSNGVLVNSENAKQNSSGSRGGVFVNSENAKQSWLREEEKIISISPNGNGRSHNDRLYAYYDRKTDRMYVFHYLTDHDTSNKDTMNKLIAEGPDAINYDIMEKINAHQVALDSGQKPEGLGFEDAKVHLNARQIANLARERLDLDEVFKSKPHLKETCTFLQGEFHNAKYEPANFEALKEMCMDPDGNFLPNTVEGKQTILQYAETDPEFKKFLEEMYVEYEKIHPLKTDAEIKAETNTNGPSDDGRDGGGTTENPDNNKPKANGDQPNSDAEQPNRANQNGDQPDNNAEQPNRANQNGDQPNSDGRNTGNQTRRRLRTLSQNAWQNIDPNDPSKGIQKKVQNPGEARRMMGQYQQLGIKCRYNENTNSIEITDAESVQKLHELRTRNTTHGTRTNSGTTHGSTRSRGRRNNTARTNGSTPRRGRGRGNPIQTVINLAR